MSQRPYLGMRDAKLPIELIETRYVRDAFKAIQSRPIGKDARGTAQLMRFAWFRPVHSKSLPALEVWAALTALKLLQTKNHDIEMSLRRMLRGFGLRVGPTTSRLEPLPAGSGNCSAGIPCCQRRLKRFSRCDMLLRA